jgi:hypothetical protein
MPPPLVRQTVSLPLYGGQREDVDEKLIGPGQFTRLENYVLDGKLGKLTKRRGYDSTVLAATTMDTGYLVSGLSRVASTGPELIAVDTAQHRLLAKSDAHHQWLDRGDTPSCYVKSRKPLLRDSHLTSCTDCAAIGNWLVYAWVEYAATSPVTVRITVVDKTTGGRVMPDRVHTGLIVRLVQLDGIVFIVWLESLAAGFKYERLTIAGGFEGANVLLAGPLPVAGLFFSVARWSATTWAFAHTDGATLFVDQFSSVPVWLGTQTIVEGTANLSIGEPGTSGIALAVWQNVLTLRGALLDTVAFAWVGAPFDIDPALPANVRNTAVTTSGTDSYVVYDPEAALVPLSLRAAWVTAGGVVVPMPETHSVGVASKPFVRGGRLHVLAQYTSAAGIQDSFFLLSLHTQGVARRGRVVTTVLPREGPHAWGVGAVSSWIVDGDERRIALPVGNGIVRGTMIDSIGADEFVLSFSPDQQWLPTRVRSIALLGGGVPSIYDGHKLAEAAFQVFPDGVTATPIGGGGHLSAGQYQYKFVYERTLNDGTLMRSAPSPAVTVTAVANDSIRCEIPYLWLTNAQGFGDDSGACRIVPYRTLATATTFYRVYDERRAPPGALINSIVAAGARSTTWIDTIADADIDEHTLLYAQDGVLDHVCPPSATISCVHLGRVFLAEGQRLWYSQPLEDGVAPSFNDDLTFAIENDGGPITGLCSDGTSLVIFQAQRIWRLYGWGPNKLGQQSDYQEPQEVARGIGCDEPRSIVRCPVGVVFAGAGTIHLLGPDGLADIGQAVRTTLESYPTITSAVALPAQQCVMLTATYNTTSVILYWHFPSRQWATHRHAAKLYTSACEHDGAHVIALETDSSPIAQNEATLRDNGAWVVGLIETSWIKPSILAGVQKARRAVFTGEAHAFGAIVTINVGYDYLPAYAETHTWQPAELGVPLQLDCWINTPRCRAVRFRISDALPPHLVPPPGENWPPIPPPVNSSVSWVGLDLEFAVKPGLHKQRAADRK